MGVGSFNQGRREIDDDVVVILIIITQLLDRIQQAPVIRIWPFVGFQIFHGGDRMGTREVFRDNLSRAPVFLCLHEFHVLFIGAPFQAAFPVTHIKDTVPGIANGNFVMGKFRVNTNLINNRVIAHAQFKLWLMGKASLSLRNAKNPSDFFLGFTLHTIKLGHSVNFFTANGAGETISWFQFFHQMVLFFLRDDKCKDI